MFKQTRITVLISALTAGVVFAGAAAAAPQVNRPIVHNAGEIRSDVKENLTIGIKSPLARHGADDKQSDDRGGRRISAASMDQLARHGADDRQSDDRGGRRISAGSMDQLVRHGADDRQRDDRGGRRISAGSMDQLVRHGADDRQRDDRGNRHA